MPFIPGESYTRDHIHKQVGGEKISYLPQKDGRIVCGCFSPDSNPEAPYVILVGGPDESAGPDRWVHLSIVYEADGLISVYRDGQPYGRPYRPEGTGAATRVYPAATSHILIGLRHTGSTNGSLAGRVDEARLYDCALRPEEVADSFRPGADRLPCRPHPGGIVLG